MNHDEIYERFKLHFSEYFCNYVDAWFPNGLNSIRIVLINGQELIFSYKNHLEWKIESLKSFINNMRGEDICD